MTRARFLALLPPIALAACVPAPEPVPTPTPAPAPVPSPAPAPVPPPFAGNWMDAPLTPGDWSYEPAIARFGLPGFQPYLSLRCDRLAGAVELFRAGTAAMPVQMIVRAEIMERSLAAEPTESDPPTVLARVGARDPLLDAMAFSKGRFAIEVAGLETLYIPSYPEVTRVIEDCR
jgi:hypothetical protein